MKIDRMDVGMVEFGGLCIGEAFADVADTILMKILPMNDEYGEIKNAVNLLTGRLECYDDNEKVKPAKAKVVVE